MNTNQLRVNHYGCCKCQKRHCEDQDIYLEHIMFQSKHGIGDMSIEERTDLILKGHDPEMKP